MLPKRCAVCGLRYRDFRSPDQPTFADAKQEMWVESDDSTKWKRRSRGVVLGRMHEHKQEYWKQHLDACEAAQDEVEWLLTFEDEVPF